MSLSTPIAIRTLQRKLYRKAKAEPAFRFYLLYDKIHREDILRHAYALARFNAGAPGVDGMTFTAIEAAGFEDNVYGYRPVRGAVDAVKEVRRLIGRGYTDVVDADLSRYFDSIPHDELLKSVARRIVDRRVLRLIKLWLKAPIEERHDSDGTRRIGGGKSNTRGTPQGGVASPLLANIYMNRFLKYWRRTGCGQAFRAHVIAYADDFVILSRGYAAEGLAWTRRAMTRLGLT